MRGVIHLLVSKRNIILKSVLCTLFSKELLPTSKVLYNTDYANFGRRNLQTYWQRFGSGIHQ